MGTIPQQGVIRHVGVSRNSGVLGLKANIMTLYM
jgi:hypothetical protein